MGLEKIFETFHTKIMSSEKFLVLKELFKAKREKNIKVSETPISNNKQIKNQEIPVEIILSETKNTNSHNSCDDNSSQKRENFLTILNNNLENSKVILPSKFETIIDSLDNQNFISHENTSYKLYKNIIYSIDEVKLILNILRFQIEILDSKNIIYNNSSEYQCINNEISIQKANNEKTYIEVIFNNEVSVQKTDMEKLSNKNNVHAEILDENISNSKTSIEKFLNINIFNKIIYIENKLNKKLIYKPSYTMKDTLIYQINNDIIYLKIESFNFHIPIK